MEKNYEYYLMEQLARLHGDGGHYFQEHGLDKACLAADAVIVELMTKANERDDLKKALDKVLAWIHFGIPEDPQHNCGNPDSPCDTLCLDWATFCTDYTSACDASRFTDDDGTPRDAEKVIAFGERYKGEPNLDEPDEEYDDETPEQRKAHSAALHEKLERYKVLIVKLEEDLDDETKLEMLRVNPAALSATAYQDLRARGLITADDDEPEVDAHPAPPIGSALNPPPIAPYFEDVKRGRDVVPEDSPEESGNDAGKPARDNAQSKPKAQDFGM